MDPHIKGVMKKFPVIEQPKQGQQSPLFVQREAIQEQLGDAYGALVDLAAFHDAVGQLLMNLTDQQFHFEAKLNTEITRQFLNLVCTHFAALELMSRFVDRRNVAGVYHCTYELLKGVGCVAAALFTRA